MANAFSVPASMGQYVDPVNENLINQVLQSKDKKYDYNVAKIDNLISQYTSLPLARDKDKKYLEGRLNNILNVVNTSGKIDMSSGNVTRQIQQNINTAIDDEVVTQMANSKSLMNFEQNVAQKREKSPDLYDDRNYSYAKKMAGVNQYLSGETDGIGSLKYQDYYDIDKNLTGELEKWAKDFGKTKRVETATGEFVIQKATIEELTPEQIENFYRTKMQADPRLASQMVINADSQYGGISDEQFKVGYVNSIKATKGKLTSQIAALDEERKNTPDGSPRLLELDAIKQRYSDQSEMYDKEIEKPNFNRQSKQLEIYSDNLLQGYKRTYASSNVTAIDFDDTPMKIKEFGLKQQTLQLKIDQTNAEKAAAATGQGVGTEFSSLDQLADKEKEDPFTQQEKIFTASYNKLDGYLMSTDENYAKGDAATKKAIREQLVKSSEVQDIGAQGYSSEKMQLVDDYVQNSKVYTKAKSQINNKISTEVETYFNGMKDSVKNVNLGNLKETMPITAQLLGDNSTLKFSSLTSKQKAQVRMEMAANLRDHVTEDDLDKKFLNNYIQTIEKGTGLKNKPVGRAGYSNSLWESIKGGSRLAFNTFTGAASAVKNVFNPNQEDIIKSSNDTERDIKSSLLQFNSGRQGMNSAIGNFFSNDRTLGDIDSDEISLEQGQSLRSRWGGISGKIVEDVKNSLGTSLQNATISVGKSYNPNVKEEKPFTQALQSIVISQGFSPQASSPYKIQLSPDKKNAIITVNTETLATNDKGVQKKTIEQNNQITIPVNNLPQNVLSGLNLADKSWAYSAKNPSEFKKTHKHKVFADADSRDIFLNKFVENNPDLLNQQEIYNIASNPGSTPFKTTKDYNEIADRTARVHGLNNQALSYIQNNIIAPDYFVEYERVAGRGFIAKVKKTEGNSSVEVSRMSMGSEDYNPSVFSARSFAIIDSVIQKQIQDYAKQHSNK